MKIGIFTPPAAMTNLEALRQAAEAGCKGFEPFAAAELAEPDMDAARRLKEEAEALGMTIPCLSVGVDITAPGVVERLKGYAECTAAMGARYLHHTIYPYLDPALASVEFEPLLEKAVSAAREVFDYASSLGVGCIYENQGFVFNGIARYAAFLRALERPAGVVVDMGNIAFVGEEADAFAREFAVRTVHVHIKDYSRCAKPSDKGFALPDGTGLELANLCEGDMRLREAAGILEKAGYDGWYMLECSPIEDGYVEQKRNIEALKTMLSKVI